MLTIVFRVFDWDLFKDSDEIGEVIGHNSVNKTKQFLLHQAQVPLWKLNLSTITDEWKNLHEFTGTKDRPVLKAGLQPRTTATDC